MNNLPLVSKEDAYPDSLKLWKSMPGFDMTFFHVKVLSRTI